MGNVKWPVYRPLGLCGVLLLAGKPASSGERVKVEKRSISALLLINHSVMSGILVRWRQPFGDG